MKNRFRSWLIGLSVLATLLFQGFDYPTKGNELTADDILRNLQSAFAKIEDYTVLLHVETDIKQVRVPQMEIKVFFKQPDKLHLQSKGFAMLPREGMLINPNRFRKEDFYMSILGKETFKDMETFKLELVPRKEKIKVRKVIIWVDPVKWISLKIDTITWHGQSIKIDFEYRKFLDRYWLPVKAKAFVDLSGFKGFSSFHERSGWEKGSGTGFMDKKGEITVQFYDYRINEGIPDSIFDQE
ncbi:MAG: outer membrane lipoprotein-sorting protein [Deltaproteobacteria bacterium]|nr:outer membrane lipoprotein-sorting protein [Deltaproteobacteria bacterium]